MKATLRSGEKIIKQGKEYRFVLFGRGAWNAAIVATMQGANG